MITSWELIMAARTSWHSSEAASGAKQSKEKNGASRFISLPMKKAPDRVKRSEAHIDYFLLPLFLFVVRFFLDVVFAFFQSELMNS